MSGVLAPQWLLQALTDAGAVASGARLFSYVAGGGNVPTPVYADKALTTPLSNPYVFTSAGRGSFWLDPAITYRLRLETATGTLLAERDEVEGTASAKGWVSKADLADEVTPTLGSFMVGHKNRTVRDALSNFGTRVSICDFDGWEPLGPGFDNYAAIQGAINACPVGGVVEIPMPMPDGNGVRQPYRISQGLHIDKRMALVGVGVGTTRELIRIQPATGTVSMDYLLKIGHKPANPGDLIVGGLLENFTLYGGGVLFNDAMLVGLAGREFHLRNMGLDSGRGRGIRLQCWWDSYWDRVFMENCNAALAGVHAASSMVLLDRGWNDIPGGYGDDYYNVNNLVITKSHFEILNKTVIDSTSSANADAIFIIGGTKFENNGVTGNVDETLFDFKGVVRGHISECTLHRFRPTTGYKTVLRASSPGIVSFTGNQLYQMTADTVLCNVQGTAVIRCKDNMSWDCNGDNPILLNTSSKAIDFEYPQNGDLPGGSGKDSASRLIYGPFRSMHNVANSNVGFTFVEDTSGQLVAALEKTVFQVSGAGASICTLNPFQAIQCPVALRIGFRVRATSGTGTVELFAPSGGSERSYGTRTVTTTYSVVSWVISAGSLALIDLGRNIRFKTGSANAATMYVDGMYLEPLAHSYDAGATWDPASVASGSYVESPDITLPDAIVGDHVTVHPPESYAIPAGVFVQARVTAAATCKIQVFNLSGSPVDLASGLWFVRLNKTGYART